MGKLLKNTEKTGKSFNIVTIPKVKKCLMKWNEIKWIVAKVNKVSNIFKQNGIT